MTYPRRGDEKIELVSALMILRILSAKYKIPVPHLHWHQTATRGKYHWMGKRIGGKTHREPVITVGPECWRGTMHSLIHEFAHHMQHHDPDPDLPPKRRTSNWHHGPRFAACLRKLVHFWYDGNLRAYGWDTEYRCLREFHITGKLNFTGRKSVNFLAAAGSKE